MRNAERRPAASDPAPGGRYAVRRGESAPPRRRRRRLLLLLAVSAGLAGAGWWLGTGGTFRVRAVGTGNYRFTDEAQLQAALRPLLGRNLWTVDREAVAAALAPLPWIRDLAVRRNLPAEVRVEFREWRPLLALDGDADAPLRVVVENGRVLEFPAHLPPPDLPVLVGVGTAPPDSAGVVSLAAPLGAQALAVIAAIREAGLEGVCAVDFVVAGDDGFTVVMQDGRGSLRIGRDDFAARLRRYVLLCRAMDGDAGQGNAHGDGDATLREQAERIRAAAAGGSAVDLRFGDLIVLDTQ